MNKKQLEKFLSLFAYADEDKKKKESISYIISQMELAEQSNKVITFDKLQNASYIPNPLVDRNGTLFINSRTLWQMYDEWKRRTMFVETEIANIILMDYKTMGDIIKKPIVLGEDEGDD